MHATTGGGPRDRVLGLGRRAAGRALRARGAAAFVSVLDRIDRRRDGLLAVLMYHRVDEPDRSPDLDPDLISATPAEFEQVVTFVAERRPVISLDELLRARRGQGPLPPGAVMITFDDATGDFAAHAWPVLRRLGLPATVFVPTAFPGSGQGFWWDRLHAALRHTARRGEVVQTPLGPLDLRTAGSTRAASATVHGWVYRLPYDEAMAAIDLLIEQLGGVPDRGAAGNVLDWDALRRLQAEGVTLAAHTRTHVCLDRVAEDRAVAEIIGSLEDLRRELGDAPPALAYPHGRSTARLRERLADAGIELAFNTQHGVEALADLDWLQIRRMDVERSAPPAVIGAHLLPTITRLRAAHGR